MTTQKAIRATIELSKAKINCFQMPNGEYTYSQTDAVISIADGAYSTQQAAKRYIEICTSKNTQHLAPQGFSNIQKVKIDGENQTFNAISQADVITFWAMAGFLGYTKAFALLIACGVETLERRADFAFGVHPIRCSRCLARK